jgi:predicted phage-related endonuclease
MDNDRNTPATKADLADLKAELKAEIKADLAEIKADLAEREDRLTEVMRDVQTELLKSFYGFMETIQIRFKEQDDTEAGLKRRLTVLEGRILEVEKRLNMPPAA